MRLYLTIFVGLIWLLVPTSVAGFQIEQKVDQKADSRILKFPVDRSMGTLSIAPMTEGKYKTSFLFGFEGFKEIGQARGEVKIPANSWVRLEVSAAACKNLKPLGDLTECCRFAGAVGTDEAVYRTLGHGQVDRVDGGLFAKSFRDLAKFDGVGHGVNKGVQKVWLIQV